jgi:di/tricarboxylate transporter
LESRRLCYDPAAADQRNACNHPGTFVTSEGPQLEALVRAVPFFAGLNPVDLARLVGALEEEKHAAHDVIFQEAGGADALYLVDRGRVRVSVRAPEGERTVTEIGEGMHFGEFGLLLGRRTASATARTDVSLRKLPRERFEELVRESPTLGLGIAAALATLVDRRSRESVGAPVPIWETTPLGAERPRPGRSTRRTVSALAISVAVPLLLWGMPPPEGLSLEGWRVVVIVLGVAVAWLLEPLPDFIVTLLMAAAWGIAGLAPLPSIFAGFTSPSWVLGLGALTLAAAMVRSGLMFRASLAVLHRFPASHRGQVLALLTGGLLITPVVPLSIGRVAAIAPFTKELARGLGYRDGSPGAASLAIAGIIGYGGLSSIFLTGLAMNFFVLDLLPSADRLEATWFNWLIRAAPIGLVLLVGSALFLLVWFRPGTAGVARHVAHQERMLGSLSPREKVTLGALAVMLVGFVAQPLLKMNPAWFAIGAMALAVGGGGLNRDLFRRAIDWGFLVQFGVLLGAGGVLHANGVDAWVAARLVSLIGDGWGPGTLVMLLAGFVFLCRLCVPWIPATLLLSLALVPAAPHLGLRPWVVGFVVLVAANAWLHPSQSDYCRVSRETAGGELFDQRQALIAGVAMTLLTLLGFAVAIPYWQVLGLLER